MRQHLVIKAFVLCFLVSSSQADFLYFTDVFSPTFDHGRLQRFDVDSSDLLKLAELDGGLRGLALDEAGSGIFVTNVETDEVLRGVPDQGFETILATDLSFPQDIARVDDRLFWIDATDNAIRSASTNGTNVQTLLDNLLGVAIDIDTVNDKLYFEDRVTAAIGSIRRMDLDGSAVETIISDVPTATSIAVDPLSQTVFWGSSAGLSDGNGGLYRVNFDGTGFEEIFLLGNNRDTGALAFDEANNQLYFALQITPNREAIVRIGPDGSNPVVLAAGFGGLVRMELSSEEIGVIIPDDPPAPSRPPNIFSNPETIVVPAAGTSGVAGPYPSTIDVVGLTGGIRDVDVTLHGITHECPPDLDVLLVGPEGQAVMLMSDNAICNNVGDVEITFDDEAFVLLPSEGSAPLVSGSYHPTISLRAADAFVSPAPSPPASGLFRGTLASFDSRNPNGTWQLFVMDDSEQYIGAIEGGWSLALTVPEPTVPFAQIILLILVFPKIASGFRRMRVNQSVRGGE